MPLPLRIPLHMSGLARPFGHLYFGMCAKDLVSFRELLARLEQSDDMKNEYELLYQQALEASVRPVVFGAMCVEAVLFDLATVLFGSGFASENDRKTPLNRFKSIAERVDRETPSDEHPASQAIAQLFKARNRLVHYKSEPYVAADWNAVIASFSDRHTIHMQGLSVAFSAAVHLSLYFDGNIFEELRLLPSFKKPEYWQTVVPASLHTDVRQCIAAHHAAGADA